MSRPSSRPTWASPLPGGSGDGGGKNGRTPTPRPRAPPPPPRSPPAESYLPLAGHRAHRRWGALVESTASSGTAHHPHHPRDYVGVIYGDVGSTAFRCAVFEPLERNDYVQVRHETAGWVLGRVDDLERRTDLSLDPSLLLRPRE